VDPTPVEQCPPTANAPQVATAHIVNKVDGHHVPGHKDLPENNYSSESNYSSEKHYLPENDYSPGNDYSADQLTVYNNSPINRGFILPKRFLSFDAYLQDQQRRAEGAAAKSTSNLEHNESAVPRHNQPPPLEAQRARSRDKRQMRPRYRSATGKERRTGVDSASYMATVDHSDSSTTPRSPSPIRTQQRKSELMSLLPFLTQRLGILSSWVKDCSLDEIYQSAKKPSCFMCGLPSSVGECGHEAEWLDNALSFASRRFEFGIEADAVR
jgi:hypothetical protein